MSVIVPGGGGCDSLAGGSAAVMPGRYSCHSFSLCRRPNSSRGWLPWSRCRSAGRCAMSPTHLRHDTDTMIWISISWTVYL